MGLWAIKARNRIYGRKDSSPRKKLIATSKLKKAKDLNFKITPYKEEVFEIISYCAKNIEDRDYKYFNENKAEKELNIIVTSTLGLCGGYNIAIEKYVLNN